MLKETNSLRNVNIVNIIL